MLDPRYNTNLTRLRQSIETTVGERSATFRTTEVWAGPYALLKLKQESLWASASSSTLTPDDAGHGTLTVVYELTRTLPVGEGEEEPGPVYELIWQELRKPVEEHPHFADLTSENHAAIAAALSGEADPPTTPAEAVELYALKIKGVTEYAIGVPVIRATESGLTARPSSTPCWVRDNPPAGSGGPAGYEWMLTACEIRQEGTAKAPVWSRSREWTGAEAWDSILYPAPE